MNIAQTFRHLAIILIGIMLISSCEVLDLAENRGKGPERSPIQTADCDSKLAFEKIKKIFDEKIPEHIDCIKANLDDFITLVKSERPGELSKDELAQFIRSRDIVDKPEDIVKILDVLFEVSQLFFSGSKKFITQANLNNLISLAKVINVNGIKIKELFDESSNNTYAYHRIRKKQVFRSASTINQKLVSIFNKKDRNKIDKVDILSIIDSFEFDDRDTKRKIKDLLFLKRVIMGGSPYELTHVELRNFLDLFKAPNMSEVLFDISKLNKLRFEDEVKKYELYKQGINKLIDNFSYNDNQNNEDKPDTIVFSMDEITNALKWFADDIGIDLYKNRIALEKIKEIFLTKTDEFTIADFNKIRMYTDELANMGIFFVNMYNYQDHKQYLNSERRLSRSFDDYVVDPLEQRYKDRFIRVTKDYRFFRSSTLVMPHFFTGFDRQDPDDLTSDIIAKFAGFKRSASGAFEIGMMEYIFEIFFDYFEKEIPCDSSYLSKTCPDGEDRARTLHLGQIREIIEIFKEPLYDMEIILKGRDDISAENTTLMPSLFQYQSNKNGLVDVVEAVEFAVGIFAVAPLGGDVYDKVKTLCKAENPSYVDRWERIEPVCFRKHFFDVLATVNNEKKIVEDDLDSDGKILTKDCKDLASGKKYTNNATAHSLSTTLDDNTSYVQKTVTVNFCLLKDDNGQYYEAVIEDANGDGEVSEEEKLNYWHYSYIKNKANDDSASCTDHDYGKGTLRENLKKFYCLVDEMNVSEKKEYVLTIERFTRPCKGDVWEDIPMSKNDSISILGGLYNVESTINRYDFNENNQMDADEVDVAFETYEGAIKGIIKDMDMDQIWIDAILGLGLHKQIFQYMIKYNKVPDTKEFKNLSHFLGFLISFSWKADASRATIAGILKNIALQSKAARNSKFDCNKVRYPAEPK